MAYDILYQAYLIWLDIMSHPCEVRFVLLQAFFMVLMYFAAWESYAKLYWSKGRHKLLEDLVTVPEENLYAELRGWYRVYHVNFKDSPALKLFDRRQKLKELRGWCRIYNLNFSVSYGPGSEDEPEEEHESRV